MLYVPSFRGDDRVSMRAAVLDRARAWFRPQRPGPAPSPRQREAMKFYVTAGEARARTAPGDVESDAAPVAVSLLRDAVLCLLRALHHARHPEAELGAVDLPPEALYP